MIDFGYMPGMSPIDRIARLGTLVLHKVKANLRRSKCVSNMRLPKICVGDFLYERWLSQGKKHTNNTAKFQKLVNNFAKIAEDKITSRLLRTDRNSQQPKEISIFKALKMTNKD